MFPALAVGAGEAMSVDPDTLDDDELAAALVALHRVDATLAAARARLTAAFEARRVWGGGRVAFGGGVAGPALPPAGRRGSR